MTLRRSIVTEWLWCFLALQAGHRSFAAAPTPPQQVPKTIEAQAKFFQDFFSVQLSPHNLEFGHVCEDPNNWEQRYEKKDFKNHRDMGKVRWGDKKGGYGEHYWDLNHAGHNNDHDNYDNGSEDDGSYKYDDSNDAYEEPSETSPVYGTEESAYDPEKASKSEYDANERAKRAHQRLRADKKPTKKVEDDQDLDYRLPKNNDNKNLHIEQDYTPDTDQFETNKDSESEEEIVDVKRVEPKPKRVLKHKAKEEEPAPEVKKITYEDVQAPQFTPKRKQAAHQPQPYEHSPAVRNYQSALAEHNPAVRNYQPALAEHTPAVRNYQPALAEHTPAVRNYQPALAEHTPAVRNYQPALAPTPSRLILDPSSGQIIDKVTGQAYVLQPVAPNYN